MTTAPIDRRRALRTALVLTAAFLCVEVVGGILTHSLALLADAGHMLTDVGGLVLSLIAMRLATRPPTPERTYGYYRAEILAAVANAVVLLGISGFLVYEAARRIAHPPEIHSNEMLGIALVGLVVNGVSLFVLRGGADGSLNVKGAYFEVLSDFVTSIGVIAGAAVMWRTGWYAIDPLISGAIGLAIVPRTWVLLREGVDVLLEGTPRGFDTQELRSTLAGIAGVVDVHDLHVWSLTSGMHAMSVHVVAAVEENRDVLLERVRRCAQQRFAIGHVTVQVESIRCGSDTHA